jgi:regulator of sigma E protease
MLLLLGVLIVLHELGHMYVARWCGVKVEKFAIGLPFGPVLWRKQWQGMEWLIHALPLGGYVAFVDDNEDSTIPDDSLQRFKNQPWYNRLYIAMAGIAVNFVVAVVLMVTVLASFGTIQTKLVIEGFQPVFSTVTEHKNMKFLPPVQLLDTYGLPLLAGVTPLQTSIQLLPWLSEQPASRLRLVNANNQAVIGELSYQQDAVATLPLGSTLLTVNDQPIEGYMGQTLPHLKKTLQQYKEQSVTLQVAPVDGVEPTSVRVKVDAEGRLGLRLTNQNSQSEPLPFADALTVGTSHLFWMAEQNFDAFGKLFTGQLSINQVDGPIGIVRYGGDVIEQSGLDKGLLLTAIISMLLAVMNLLPIPPLDGSYLVYIGYELIMRKPFPEEAKQWLNQGFFFVLIGFMLLILGNDVWKLISIFL